MNTDRELHEATKVIEMLASGLQNARDTTVAIRREIAALSERMGAVEKREAAATRGEAVS